MNQAQRWLILITLYIVFLLIAITSMLAVAGFLPNVDGTFRTASVALLVTEIAGGCVVVFRTQFAGSDLMHVNVAFPGVPPTGWVHERCQYEIRSHERKEPKRGPVLLQKAPGGWSCSIPLKTQPNDLAAFRLVDSSGCVWEVPLFSPNVVNVAAQHAQTGKEDP